MCSNVNSREILRRQKKRGRGGKKKIARTGRRNLVEKRKLNREKIQMQEEERKNSERKGEYTRSRERGEERERMRKSLKLNIV